MSADKTILGAVRKFELLDEGAKHNIIDVGCHKAHWLDEFQKSYQVGCSIGVDPENYNVEDRYTHYYQKAVAVEEEVAAFYQYAAPGCNSLLIMRKDIVSDPEEEGFYLPPTSLMHAHQRVVRVAVDTIRLDTIIQEHPEVLPIDFLKIDTQGTDLNVVKSLGLFLKQVKLIQMEAVDGMPMYIGQTHMSEDIKQLAAVGFRLIATETFLPQTEVNLLFGRDT